MGHMRGVGVAGAIALIAVPAVALADSPEKPAAGLWGPSPPGQTYAALTHFTVASSRQAVTSVTFIVQSSDTNPGCPTGNVSIPGPLGLKEWKFAGTRPFWAFGRVVHKAFKEAPVAATLDGQPLKGATLTIQFNKDNIGGVATEISGGTFSFNSKCGAALTQDENAG